MFIIRGVSFEIGGEWIPRNSVLCPILYFQNLDSVNSCQKAKPTRGFNFALPMSKGIALVYLRLGKTRLFT